MRFARDFRRSVRGFGWSCRGKIDAIYSRKNRFEIDEVSVEILKEFIDQVELMREQIMMVFR